MTHTNAETSKPHHIEPEPSAEVCFRPPTPPDRLGSLRYLKALSCSHSGNASVNRCSDSHTACWQASHGSIVLFLS